VRSPLRRHRLLREIQLFDLGLNKAKQLEESFDKVLNGNVSRTLFDMFLYALIVSQIVPWREAHCDVASRQSGKDHLREERSSASSLHSPIMLLVSFYTGAYVPIHI